MADQNINNMTVTWNSGGTTFNAVKMNVTDTASAAASLLLLFQVGGSDKFKVGKDGTITGAGNLSIAGNATITGNVTINGTLTAAGIAGTVTGPVSSTDNAIARFNGTTGGVIQNSGVTIDDNNVMTLLGSAAGILFALQSTDAGASPGPNIDLYRNSASPAASDILSQIVFHGQDSAGNKTAYAEITAQIADPTNGSEDGTFYIATNAAGAYAVRLSITGSALTYNGNATINGTLTVTG